jgi:hypothetical protein
MSDIKFSKEEIENSKRIFKSATPKYTLDWYVKWVASVFVMIAMSMRGVEEFVMYDLSLSIIGIVLNGVGLLFLLRNFVENILL